MGNTFFDIVILILRIALVFVLYFFIYLIVRVITREFNASSKRRSAYPAETVYPPQEAFVAPPLNPSTGVPGRLVVTAAGNASTVRPGMVFQLQPVTPIGRRPDNVIVLNDDFVSGEHSLIALRDGNWWLSDVASTNGTTLNEQQLQQPAQLKWGDVVGVGRVRLRLEP